MGIMRDRKDYLAAYREAHREELKAKSRAWYAANREEKLLKTSAYRKSHREQYRAYSKAWSAEHREQETQRNLRWRLANPEKWQALMDRFNARNPDWQKNRDRKWKQDNPALHAANVAAHRALKLMAQPSWVKREELAAFYIEAKRKTLITGIPHEVDHIWPLKGRGFVGLNVPWNLQVITWKENNSKRNKRPAVYREA